MVEFYRKCHTEAVRVALNAKEGNPVFCTQADYIHMMGLQKIGFLKSMLIWPFDVVRMLFTELFRLAYDVAFALYQEHGGKLLRWADKIRQKYSTK